MIYEHWFVQFDFPDASGKPYKSSGGAMKWCDSLKCNIPAGWEFGYVGEYLKKVDRGISYSSADIASPHGIAMLNLACFDKSANYRTGELKKYSGKFSSTDLVYPGDMLIACTDLTRNADIIGRPIFAPWECQEYVFSTDLAKISVKTEISKEYLYYTLRTDAYHRYIKPFASGTNVLHLNIDGVLKFSIVIPPTSLLDKFTTLAESIIRKTGYLLNENLSLIASRDWLLPMLMSGQVTVEE